MTAIRRAWPPSAGAGGPALDDDALTEAYGRPAAPTLRVNFVSSADGAVALDGFSEGLSGPADKRVFGILRMVCDALLVGAGTMRHEGYRPLRLDAPRRAWREERGLPPYPTLVVVSASLDLDPGAPVFAEAPVRPIVLTGASATEPPGLSAVAEVRRSPGPEVDLPAHLADLRGAGLAQVLCEGGPTLLGSLTAADLVDELCLTLSPVLAGAGAGRITAGAPSPPRHLGLRHALVSDDLMLLRYTRP